LKKLYDLKDSVRCYNIYNVNEIDLFCSELSIFCNKWISYGGNLFFLKNSSNYNINLVTKEIDYIYLLDQGCKNFEYLDFDNNVKYLMENQKNDLLLLDLEKINFFFLIPEFDENNKYYFNLFISFKDECVYNNMLNLNFNIISIDYINRAESLSFFDVKTIFNFNKSKFSINKFDYRFIDILNINSEKKKIDIKPLSVKDEENMIINFLKECVRDSDINKNENLKSEIKEALSQYLKKSDIDKYDQFKKISYFFY
jgi:hypothetical protein